MPLHLCAGKQTQHEQHPALNSAGLSTDTSKFWERCAGSAFDAVAHFEQSAAAGSVPQQPAPDATGVLAKRRLSYIVINSMHAPHCVCPEQASVCLLPPARSI